MTDLPRDGHAYRHCMIDGKRHWEKIPRDENGFTMDSLLAMDEHNFMQNLALYIDTGVWTPFFSYPGCSAVLVDRGWVSVIDERGYPTEAGYQALTKGPVQNG